MSTTSTKSKTQTKSLTDRMNQQVANFSVLYMKLHHYHWYVKGANFFTLHMKFEELYKEAALHLDTIAERMLVLRATPASTLQEALELSVIKEASEEEDAETMMSTLAEDLDTLCKELTETITLAEEQEDEPTADMFVHIRTSLEKHRWMVEAYLTE
ncbi:Dps family protein [Neobacillus sp. K501]